MTTRRWMGAFALVSSLAAAGSRFYVRTAGQPAAGAEQTPSEKEPPSEAQVTPCAPVSAGAALEGTPGAPFPRSAPSGSPRLPLVPGFTYVIGWSRIPGDYEVIERIDRVTADSVHVSGSSPVFSDGAQTEGGTLAISRTICREDLENAHVYLTEVSDAQPEILHATTMFSVSSAVFDDLKTKGATAFRYMQNAQVVDATTVSGDEWAGTLSRVEPDDVPFAVIVNDQRVELPAIHARGRAIFMDDDTTLELYVLDDRENPFTLRLTMDTNNFQVLVTKISYPTQAAHIEKALEQTGRAEVYGISFDFACAAIRPESEPTLKQIADMMSKNTTWKLDVEGHTDNIGGDSYNLDLSNRRAAAVKQALVERYHIDATRLRPSGFGASRPKESNDTLEGRARNRRVELVRQQDVSGIGG